MIIYTIPVYHCSPVCIDSFDFTHGVHFGGKLSAYEACLRKNVEEMFLHTCFLRLQNVTETLDLGSVIGWDRLAKEMRSEGFYTAKYVNKYEPDLSHSYFVVESPVVEVVSVEIVKANEAEKTIEMFHREFS